MTAATAERILLNGLGNPYERLQAIRAVATPERTASLRALPYPAFLATPYWRVIRQAKMHDQAQCERCGAGHALQVHHQTYAHHGREHDHLDDLEVLCRDCHALHHGIPTVTAGWHRTNWRSVGELIPAAMGRIARGAV